MLYNGLCLGTACVQTSQINSVNSNTCGRINKHGNVVYCDSVVMSCGVFSKRSFFVTTYVRILKCFVI